MTGIRHLSIPLLLVACLVTSGCITVKLDDGESSCAVWPTFPETERPVLEIVSAQELAPLTDDAKKKLLVNDHRLKNHAKRLEAQIATYMELRTERFGE